jgi:hypothetical protein
MTWASEGVIHDRASPMLNNTVTNPFLFISFPPFMGVAAPCFASPFQYRMETIEGLRHCNDFSPEISPLYSLEHRGMNLESHTGKPPK